AEQSLSQREMSVHVWMDDGEVRKSMQISGPLRTLLATAALMPLLIWREKLVGLQRGLSRMGDYNLQCWSQFFERSLGCREGYREWAITTIATCLSQYPSVGVAERVIANGRLQLFLSLLLLSTSYGCREGYREWAITTILFKV